MFGGIGVGVAMAAPVGPVAALCISVTLHRGRTHGMVAGLGAALADAMFAAVAVLGFASVTAFASDHDALVRLLAGVVLGAFAIARLVSLRRRIGELSHAELAAERELVRPRLPASFFGPLLLSLGNPATILSFVATLGALGFERSTSPAAPLLITLGVFTGAFAWWALVTFVAGHLRGRASSRTLARLDTAIVIVLLTFSAGLVVTGLLRLM